MEENFGTYTFINSFVGKVLIPRAHMYLDELQKINLRTAVGFQSKC